MADPKIREEEMQLAKNLGLTDAQAEEFIRDVEVDAAGISAVGAKEAVQADAPAQVVTTDAPVSTDAAPSETITTIEPPVEAPVAQADTPAETPLAPVEEKGDSAEEVPAPTNQERAQAIANVIPEIAVVAPEFPPAEEQPLVPVTEVGVAQHQPDVVQAAEPTILNNPVNTMVLDRFASELSIPDESRTAFREGVTELVVSLQPVAPAEQPEG